jgi:hypothetical protein
MSMDSPPKTRRIEGAKSLVGKDLKRDRQTSAKNTVSPVARHFLPKGQEVPSNDDRKKLPSAA